MPPPRAAPRGGGCGCSTRKDSRPTGHRGSRMTRSARSGTCRRRRSSPRSSRHPPESRARGPTRTGTLPGGTCSPGCSSPPPQRRCRPGRCGNDGPATAVEGVLGQPDKMRGSTYGTAQRMARALVNPQLLAWVTPRAGLPSFDPAGFPASADTLYALSREGEGSGGPFVAALTAHVCEAAERVAASSVTGRLAVPLTVELDEAANIVRWPELPKLYSHYGSQGILLHTYLQSWTQGAEAWGEYGIRAMWSAATIRVLGAGVADERFLSEFSSLIGDREEWVFQSVYTSSRGDRQRTHALRKERALAVSDLASLPKDRAVVFASGSRPVVIATVPWMDGPHAAGIRDALGGRP